MGKRIELNMELKAGEERPELEEQLAACLSLGEGEQEGEGYLVRALVHGALGAGRRGQIERTLGVCAERGYQVDLMVSRVDPEDGEFLGAVATRFALAVERDGELMEVCTPGTGKLAQLGDEAEPTARPPDEEPAGEHRGVLFTVSNHHGAGSRVPPRLDGDQKGRYVGYFATERGEQALFAYDRAAGHGVLMLGDAGWGSRFPVLDGVARGAVLEETEKLWLGVCWMAATGSKRR